MRIAYNPKDVTPLTGVSSDSQDIIFDLSGMAIYARGIKFSGTDTTYEVFTSTTTGLVPVPGNNNSNRFLREDGTWAIPAGSSYNVMTLEEAIAGTSTDSRVITAKVLHDKISSTTTNYTYSKSTIDTKLGDYLPLSGGQINGALIINRDPSVIFFKRNGTTLGSIGFSGDLNPIIFNATSNTSYNLWHSGNSNLSSVDWNASKLILNTTNTTDWNVAVRSSTIQLLRTGDTAGNAPYSYSSGISIMTSYTGFQLASHGGSSNEFYFRSVQDDGAWLPWKTVAFTDSKVASATNADKVDGHHIEVKESSAGTDTSTIYFVI